MDLYAELDNHLTRYHPHQPEFHQAVHEVIEDIKDFYEDNKRYRDWSIIERLIEPDRVIQFRVCWEDDTGNVQVNRAWRVQFNNVLGAYKGGMRFHPTVNESILKFLGFEQCFKNALTGMPMGGGKGGADFDPKGKSEREVYRFCCALMQELYKHIGPQHDVPAGDIGVGGREIGYMFGHYLKLTDQWQGVLTGKSPLFGGSSGREEATGYGLVYFLENMLQAHDNGLKDKGVVISGSGNVAIFAAEKCLQENAKVLSLSDSGGTLYFKDGITVEQLAEMKELKLRKRGRLKAYEGKAEYQKGKKPWSIAEADIALPCATQNEIDVEDAQTLFDNKLIAVAEGANMPLTAEAQDVMLANPILYAPGKASNAGGVAVSGLERTQNAEMRGWKLERVDEELKTIMRDIHTRCTENIDRVEGLYPYRKGANISSFKKLADTLVAYGIK